MPNTKKKPDLQFVATLVGTFLLGLSIGFTAYPIFFPGHGGGPAAEAAGDAQPRPESNTVHAGTAENAPPPSRPEPQPAAPASPAATPAEPDYAWAARHLFVNVRGTALDAAAQRWIADLRPGGVLLLGHNVESESQTAALVEQIKTAYGEGTGVGDMPLVAVDQEGGIVNRLGLADAPSARDLGDGQDEAGAEAAGRRYAEAARARGIGVLFAPVLDVYQTGAKAGLSTRAFGDDPAVVTSMGLAFAKGVMDGGAIPVAKHYPGHGGVTQDSHEVLAVLDKPIADLAHDMYPFTEAIAWGIPGIMTGHIAVPALEDANPNLPASLSPRLVQQMLREVKGYDGVIITDDLVMKGITNTYSLAEAAVLALEAGCDALIVSDPSPDSVRAVCRAIAGAVASGRLSREQLDASQARLGLWQAWLRNPVPNETAMPETPLPPADAAASVEAPEAVDEAAGDSAPADAAAEPPAGTPITHVVQAGEGLSRLATRYGVSQADIKRWNGLEEDMLRIDQVLTIYVDEAPNEPALEPELEPEPEPSPEPEPEPAPVEAQAPTAHAPRPGERIEHVVQAGEMLSRLAVQYGVNQADIMRSSGIDDPNIRIGQTLVIHVPGETTERTPAPAPPNTEPQTYTVQAGDRLADIAARHGVGITDILQWNAMTERDIQPGVTLTIHVPVEE